jgi:hypothetical protein
LVATYFRGVLAGRRGCTLGVFVISAWYLLMLPQMRLDPKSDLKEHRFSLVRGRCS